MQLREYLFENNIRTADFAKKSGVGLTALYKYINGKPPTPRMAYKIQKATDGKVTVEELLKNE